MSTDNTLTSNFIDSDGADLGTKYVTKSYLMSVYPYLKNVGISAPKLYLWGNNDYGSLGDSTTVSRSSPVQTIASGINWKQVDINYYFTAAIKTDGTLWTWGNNGFGQLGDSTKTHRSSPVQTIAAGTTWKQVACGYAHIAAIKTDGTLWLWGYNGFGQLGDSTKTHRSSPIQTIAAGTTWKQVACGNNHTVAVKVDGSLWLWGYNYYSQLGDSTQTHRSSPVQTIAAGTTWKQVSAGYGFTAAVKTDGSLWLWGSNGDGQLGDSTSTDKSSPVQTIAAGTTWRQVVCGYTHIAAIKTDGSLWLWGKNNIGMLGDNTITGKSSPAQTICGGTNWKRVACSYNHTMAIKTDGTLWVWGGNLYGQLGDSTITGKSSPVQTICGGTNWKNVATGRFMSAAVIEVGDDF